MGADHAEAAGLSYEIIGTLAGQPGSQDTKEIAQAMLDAGAELIAFAGGDGTARDMADAIGERAPVVAIPSGVKIYSAVFAYSTPFGKTGSIPATTGSYWCPRSGACCRPARKPPA
jgi:predicted polyphosphate/ATP-dependent NAD kinase